MDSSLIQAFAMSQTQAALSTHAVPANNHSPSVQIVGSSGCVFVVGTDALYALHEAIQFALKGATK